MLQSKNNLHRTYEINMLQNTIKNKILKKDQYLLRYFSIYYR